MRHLFGRLFRQDNFPWNDNQAIRAELFGVERFSEHARSLAQSQAVTRRPIATYSVVRRLRDNATSLLASYTELSATAAAGKPITPAAEWLIDNYHLIEEHIRLTTADLPQSYYRQLPKIAVGPLAGHPRIFGVAWAYVAHTDSRFDPHSLTEFINAYQDVQPLTIGELWAAAISLRLVLLENLTRISLRTVESRRAREAADQLADRLLAQDIAAAGLDWAVPLDTIEDVSLPFAVQLIRRLRDRDSTDPKVFEWLHQKVHSLDHDFETAVADEHHRQAAANVTMRNLVTSLRFISDYDWNIWFDSVSLVDKLLRGNSFYGEMDFRSRNDYRSGIEDLSQHSKLDEPEVARLALERAANAGDGNSAAASDVGYHILGNGRASLEAAIGYRPFLRRRISDGVKAAGLPGYLGAIVLITLFTLALGLWPLATAGAPLPILLLMCVLGLGPASEAGMTMVNYALTQFLRPVIVPGLALRDGVPAHLRSLVAVPALLSSHREIEELLDRLEVHYLANSAGELYFSLVTDWTDSAAEHEPADDILLAEALDGIATLNRKYGQGRFLLLHRARRWNPQQGCWMGWERKRGKLHELNRLLRNAADTSFMVIGGTLPADIRFVITLDADTKLPRDAARRLVGKLAHPLNRPQFDPKLGRIVEGYGIMQPRVTPSLPTEDNGTTFQRIFSTLRGSDPYVFAVSDVYQDLFGEGSYAGKGIYDIDAFELALAGRVPDNTLLSHDLFEGNFARTALVSDIEVVEEYPQRYAVAAARQHRWVRGDWQLLPWISGRAAASGATGSSSSLGHWKMIDNLRRSLTPMLSLLSLFVGWLFVPGALAAGWTAFITLVLFIPAFLPVFSGSSLRRVPVTVKSQLGALADDVARAIVVTGANLILLGHQAGLTADAIGRTLYRLFVSRRNLLEWTTAAQVQANTRPGLRGTYLLMASSVAAGLWTLAVAAVRGGDIEWSALPFATAWLLAPAFAYWISQPKLQVDQLEAAPADRLALRLVARRTWTYFETFVGADDNMLPPDNFQEDPKPVIAHRTSPTNIGLYLLSVASARQFGWIGVGDALARIEMTLATIGKMETFNGHLYNWYDTQTLRPLEPKYVSTVDSGNLAGHLMALANMCGHWSLAPAANVSFLEGIGDAAAIVGEELRAISNAQRSFIKERVQVERQLTAFGKSLAHIRERPELLPVLLIDLVVRSNSILESVRRLAGKLDVQPAADVLRWAGILQETIESQLKDATLDQAGADHIRGRLETAATTARAFALGMQFGFLENAQRGLMAIGFRVDEATLDENCYDMLASEAASASFLAIAKGDLRTRHWFRLSRPVTAIHGGAALVSWSGSMFEYLMPALVLRTPVGSLLDRTAQLIVQRQIEYGQALGTPWGISESAFAARDVDFTYQYSNFGVPGLGLKRGLADNIVIAPYATGLAAMVAPIAAAKNYGALVRAGARGRHGFYEAIDYTPARLRSGEKSNVVRAYFAHHQGMTIAAIMNAVGDGVIRENFHAEPIVRATELLLQERAPRQVPIVLASVAASAPAEIVRDLAPPPPRRADPRLAASPITHLLSNGSYTVMLTAAGTGYSDWNGIAINRWREDPVCDQWGAFVFFRDTRSGQLWTAGYMPAVSLPDTYNAEFNEEKVEFRRADGVYTTHLECLVSTEDNAEARRISIVNSSNTTRSIEVTTYMELALAPPIADNAHPAFSKMFIETEYVEELETLIATRRKRSPTDPDLWVAQFMLVQGEPADVPEFETDRAQFIGQGNDIRTAAALTGNRPLSGTTGAVLDPAFALRRRLRIRPRQQACCTVWTIVAESREAVLDLVDRHRQQAAFERAQILAWTHSRIQLRHMSIDAGDTNLFQQLAGFLIYAGSAMRLARSALESGIRAQSTLWSLGISGTRPILLVHIDAIEDIAIVRVLLRAHEYLSAKGLPVDFVILNDRRASYMQDLQATIEELVRKSAAGTARQSSGRAGNIYALRADILPQDVLAMLPAVARVVLRARSGSLASQLALARSAGLAGMHPGPFKHSRAKLKDVSRGGPTAADLSFFNGYGGFDAARGEYVINHDPRRPLPAPWINVIANPSFGTHCAADGGGYTWAGNSRESQITGWANDPVDNRPGECVYVRDDRSGELSGPCLSPLHIGAGKFVTRHGFGYTQFEAEDAGLRMELVQLVPLSDTLKIARLRIRTDSAAPRQLTITFYAELVLGTLRAASAQFITTEIDGETGAMFARNRWNSDFSERVVFADLHGGQSAWTGDRQEFLGRFGELAAPQSLLSGMPLSKRTGGGLDPCMALQQKIAVAPGQMAEVTILLGAAGSEIEARALIGRYRNASFDAVLSEVRSHWKDTLGAVQVRTPDPSFDMMMNGWLLYQTLACRMWARSGFYQASGAYGFRDQLQDSMALASIRPELTRQHLLRAAARQFVEGDVQHWWLPSNGMGVRTRISDDTVWLAYCVLHYIKTTGDAAVLDEMVPFIEGRGLEAGEHDAFYQPVVSDCRATLYEHCALGLERNLPAGAHGLPLIGTGDWNDGMNRVGERGQGESVWLAWFLFATLKDFEPVSAGRRDRRRTTAWRKRMIGLQQALEESGWDGKWYRRGYFDDGTPLGSALNAECQIDAIAQSWAVISGAARPERAAAALEEAHNQLVRPAEGVAVLFTPPFDTALPDPGYIKAYPKGVRENGGQYTHGVIWSIFAHAKLGQAEKAAGLFALLNPVNHARTEDEVRRYRVEPYVMAADVYSVPPHTGRGGWTWYTGAAGWMYRAGLEAILGIVREGDMLRIKPCIPAAWTRFDVTLKYGTTNYVIAVVRGAKDVSPSDVRVQKLSPAEYLIELQDTGRTVSIELPLGNLPAEVSAALDDNKSELVQ